MTARVPSLCGCVELAERVCLLPDQADMCLLPKEERTERVRVLARDFCAKKEGQKEPVFLMHPLLPGLLQVRASRAQPLAILHGRKTNLQRS